MVADLEAAQGRVVDLEALEQRVVENDRRRSLAEKLAAGAVVLSIVLTFVVFFLSAALVARNRAVEDLGQKFERVTEAVRQDRRLSSCRQDAFAKAYDDAIQDTYEVGELLAAYNSCLERFPPVKAPE
jgi:hypothetical protein